MSWINWYYGVRDQNWLLRRVYEEDYILNETWRRQHATKEEAELIPPDYDELSEMPKSSSPTEYQQIVEKILEAEHRPKKKKESQTTIRKPIPKRIRVALIRERGGICERCQENPYHHIHHVDGNPSNNHTSNLLLVCYDCHIELGRH